MDENLQWLLKWFNSQCNGIWEASRAISIGTLDNPGWCLEVRLGQSILRDKPFVNVNREDSEDNWISCSIKNNLFLGAGGPFNLPEILQTFRNRAQSKGWVKQANPLGQPEKMGAYAEREI